MTTINELSLNRPKLFPIFCVVFLFFSETLPYRQNFSVEILSLWSIPVLEYALGIRSLFLIILLNHLPQEIQILHLLGLSGLLSQSVFWDMFLMHLTCPILQCQQPECLLSKFTPRLKHLRGFTPRTKHVLEGFPKSLFIVRFPSAKRSWSSR